jgi:hypothetical protein
MWCDDQGEEEDTGTPSGLVKEDILDKIW